jgi:hypothetical protein
MFVIAAPALKAARLPNNDNGSRKSTYIREVALQAGTACNMDAIRISEKRN